MSLTTFSGASTEMAGAPLEFNRSNSDGLIYAINIVTRIWVFKPLSGIRLNEP
jgi:hypothetical protein